MKRLFYAALFCAVSTAGVAQNKLETQSLLAAGAITASTSDTAPYEIAPGIQIPGNGMVWILDQAENKPHLVRIFLNTSLVNGHLAENFVRAQFLVLKMGSTVELLGAAAKSQITSHTPAIFIRKSEEEDEEARSAVSPKSVQAHYVLLRLRVARDRRVVCTFSSWQLGLKLSRHEDVVEASTEEVAAGQWLKITPKQPLPDGEYAVVHMPDNKKLFEPNTYDFGVGPTATRPANH